MCVKRVCVDGYRVYVRVSVQIDGLYVDGLYVDGSYVQMVYVDLPLPPATPPHLERRQSPKKRRHRAPNLIQTQIKHFQGDIGA